MQIWLVCVCVCQLHRPQAIWAQINGFVLLTEPNQANSTHRPECVCVCAEATLQFAKGVFWSLIRFFFFIHFVTKYVHFTNSCHYTRYICMIIRCPFVVI